MKYSLTFPVLEIDNGGTTYEFSTNVSTELIKNGPFNIVKAVADEPFYADVKNQYWLGDHWEGSADRIPAMSDEYYWTERQNHKLGYFEDLVCVASTMTNLWAAGILDGSVSIYNGKYKNNSEYNEGQREIQFLKIHLNPLNDLVF